jgi:hypothetical protein
MHQLQARTSGHVFRKRLSQFSISDRLTRHLKTSNKRKHKRSRQRMLACTRVYLRWCVGAGGQKPTTRRLSLDGPRGHTRRLRHVRSAGVSSVCMGSPLCARCHTASSHVCHHQSVVTTVNDRFFYVHKMYVIIHCRISLRKPAAAAAGDFTASRRRAGASRVNNFLAFSVRCRDLVLNVSHLTAR